MFDEVQPDDTYLVSFPRSGSTFLRNLVTALVLDRAPTAAEVQAVVPDIHWSPSSVRPLRPGPMMAKSHAPPSVPVPARVVYLVRDGRAALLSYYRYLQQRGRPTPPHPDGMLAGFECWPCPWADHVAGWLHRVESDDASAVVRYEDLVADPAAALRGVSSLAGLACSEAQVRRAVDHSSRTSMSVAERAGGPGSLNYVGNGGRSGKGDFSPGALADFEAENGELLARLGYPAPRTGDA